MNYAVLCKDLNTFIFPFIEYGHWINWAQNTEECHRFNSQRQVFLRKNEGITNLSQNALHTTVNNGGEELNDLLRKMHICNSNIVGYSSHFYKKQKELESLIECNGISDA